MTISHFSDLDVFQRAYTISKDVHQTSLHFPKIEQYALANQIRRASQSICANIAEGFGKQRASKAEFKRFISIAIGSSDEMQVWTMYCGDFEYISQEQREKWANEYKTISKMLQSLYDKI